MKLSVWSFVLVSTLLLCSALEAPGQDAKWEKKIAKGRLKGMMGNFQGALKSYQQALKLYNKAVEEGDSKAINSKQTAATEIYMNIGLNWGALGYYELSELAYSGGIELYDESSPLYTWRAHTRKILEDYEGAADDYTKSIDIMLGKDYLREYSVSSFIQRADLKFHHLADTTGALEDYESASEIQVENLKKFLADEEDELLMGAIHMRLAEIWLCRNEKEKACEFYDQARALGYLTATEKVQNACK